MATKSKLRAGLWKSPADPSYSDRVWLKSTDMQKVVTPDGISVLDSEINFGELSDVL